MERVGDLERKVKLQYFFRQLNKNSDKLPFTENSNWIPPDKFMTSEIHTKLAELRSEVLNLNILKDKQNLSFEEKSALQNLKSNDKLVIKKADKGSATVIMYKSDYIRESERQLNNSNHYRKISRITRYRV